MRDSGSRAGRRGWGFLFLASACLAPGAALAASCCTVSTTSAVPLTYFIVQQPIDVCSNTGISCAYVNNKLQTVLSSPYTCTVNGVSTNCANIFVDFMDPGTGMLSERNIWSAIGIDDRQTPVVQYNSTASQTLQIDSCLTDTTDCTSASFSTLAQQVQALSGSPPTGISQGATPTFPRASSPLVINEFFVKNICSASSQGCTIGTVDGFGAENGNGHANANLVFSPAATGRPDTKAHEKGHNLALDHNILGAGTSAQDMIGANNLMTSGATRTVPTPTNVSGSSPLTAEWVLQVSPNATTSFGGPLDLLTTGPTCNPLSSCTNQQGAVQLSGFLNASPQATTSLFPQEEGDAVTAAASPPSQPTPTAAASPLSQPTPTAAASPLSQPTQPPLQFSIQAGIPISGQSTDACNASSTCKNAYLAEALIILTQGMFDNSSGHSFQVSYQYPNPVLTGPPQIFHGNYGNGACEGEGPTVWCLDLQFVPGAFTAANFGTLEFTIGTKPLNVSGLAGTVCYFWNTAAGAPYYNSCSDLSSVVCSGGLCSDSQLANLAINTFIPLNFGGTPGNQPCTLATSMPPATTCPDPTHTYHNDSRADAVPQSEER